MMRMRLARGSGGLMTAEVETVACLTMVDGWMIIRWVEEGKHRTDQDPLERSASQKYPL